MKGKKIKVVYVEPADYIPEDLRRKYKLGEFAEPKHEAEKMDEDCCGIQPIDPIEPPRKEDEAKSSPADYDRWGKVGIRFTSEPETEKG